MPAYAETALHYRKCCDGPYRANSKARSDVDMSTDATTRQGSAAATCRRPRRRGSTTGRRRAEPLQPRGSPVGQGRRDDRSFPDAAARRRWLRAASLGDLEGPVHGHLLFATSPCFPGSSSHQPRGSPVGQFRRDDRSFPDAAARRMWLRAASLGDLEGRVYGGHGHLLFAISPCFPGSSSHQPPLHGREEVSPAAAAALAQEQILSLFLDEIQRSIVAPRCRNPSASEFFPDLTRRLDNYLAAAKDLLQLLRHPAVASGHLRLPDRAKSLLNTTMSSLAMKFCHLKIWRPDAHLGCLPASIWESVRSSCGGCSASTSTSSWPSSSSSLIGDSSGTKDANFDAYYTALGEERTVQSDKTFSGMTYIDLKSSIILDDIAGVMIEAGYEHMLRGAFDEHCAQLARYIEILDIGNILGSHIGESREMLQRVWTSAMRVNIGVLTEMRRQLTVHDFGSFNTLKEDYFLAIAQVSVMKLLNSASSIYIQVGPPNEPSCKDGHSAMKLDPSKMVNVVMMYQELKYAMPEILALFSGQTKEFILAEGEVLINGLSAMFVKLVVELNDLLRSQCLMITDTGVHRITRHIMDHLGLLVEQKNTVYLMLKGNPDEFGQLVTQLITSLELMLDRNSRSLGLQGQQQVFLLNNVHFMLEQTNKYIDLGLILGQSWLLQRHDQLDRFMKSYVEASWAPVMSSFERRARVPTFLWPHQLFDKFTSCFEMTYNEQKTWKVTDPLIRQKLRKAIAQKVIPLYRMQMDNYSEKKQKSARYSVEQLESQLLEMFEG